MYDWVDDSPAWVEETHHLITYVDNPEGQAAIDFDCPVIDPTDTATWCPQGIDYYPVPCKYSDHIQMYLMYSAKNFIDNLTLQQKTTSTKLRFQLRPRETIKTRTLLIQTICSITPISF